MTVLETGPSEGICLLDNVLMVGYYKGTDQALTERDSVKLTYSSTSRGKDMA